MRSRKYSYQKLGPISSRFDTLVNLGTGLILYYGQQGNFGLKHWRWFKCDVKFDLRVAEANTF